MLNSRAVTTATVAGTVLQLAMVLSGHSNAAIAQFFGPVGMGISLVAGLIYASQARGGSAGSVALGGFVSGGLCALIGIVVSYALGDVTAMILALGTLSSAVAGAIGGWLGRFALAERSAQFDRELASQLSTKTQTRECLIDVGGEKHPVGDCADLFGFAPSVLEFGSSPSSARRSWSSCRAISMARLSVVGRASRPVSVGERTIS